MNNVVTSTAQPLNVKWLGIIAMVGLCFATLMASFAYGGGDPLAGSDHNLHGLAGLPFRGVSGSVEQKYGVPIPVVTFHSLGVFTFSVFIIIFSIPFVVMVAIFLGGISLAAEFFSAFFTLRPATKTPEVAWVEFGKRFGLSACGAFFHNSNVHLSAVNVNWPHHEMRAP